MNNKTLIKRLNQIIEINNNAYIPFEELTTELKKLIKDLKQ